MLILDGLPPISTRDALGATKRTITFRLIFSTLADIDVWHKFRNVPGRRSDLQYSDIRDGTQRPIKDEIALRFAASASSFWALALPEDRKSRWHHLPRCGENIITGSALALPFPARIARQPGIHAHLQLNWHRLNFFLLTTISKKPFTRPQSLAATCPCGIVRLVEALPCLA